MKYSFDNGALDQRNGRIKFSDPHALPAGQEIHTSMYKTDSFYGGSNFLQAGAALHLYNREITLHDTRKVLFDSLVICDKYRALIWRTMKRLYNLPEEP